MKYANALAIFLYTVFAHCNMEEDKNTHGDAMDQPLTRQDQANHLLTRQDRANDARPRNGHLQVKSMTQYSIRREGLPRDAFTMFAQNQRARLRKALEDGNVGATRKLIEGGVDLVAPYEDSNTPLHVASIQSKKKSKEVLKLLLAKKVPLEARTEIGETAFQRAVTYGRIDEAAMLLEAGAEINTTDEFGHTALHDKVSENRFENVEWLLHKGASLYPVNAKGHNPLDVALYKSKTFVINNPCYESDPFINSWYCKWSEIVRILIEYGADISPPKYDPMMIFEKHWESCFKLSQNHLDNFDKYVPFVTNAFLTGQSEDEPDDTLSIYVKNHLFALYRILKATYPAEKMKRVPSRLENVKIIFFEIFATGITEKTYFEMVPVELISEVLFLSERFFWRIERISFYLALISVNYNYLDVSKAFTREEIMHFIEYFIHD